MFHAHVLPPVFLLLAASAHPADQHPSNVVQAQMRNVMYHFTDRIAVHITRLDGALQPSQEGGIADFDDSRSFQIDIRAAEISIAPDALARVLNQHVFAAPDAPIKDVEITAAGTRLKMKGKLHSKGDVPFESEATLSVTADGEVRIHSEQLKAAHLPVKGLMDLLGVKIADLINTNKVQGLRVDKNDLLLNPTKILPPPKIEGHLTAIVVRGNQIVQTFGDRPSDTHGRTGNYMSYQGGQLKFGKLTMSPADLILIDPEPGDPFDFFLEHYKEQLVVGYSKTMPDDGLRVYTPDYSKLRKQDQRSPR